MSESLSQHTAILVLGMHRSGTSAVTRFLNLLGAELPDQLLDAVPGNNESGFWESREVQVLNDRLLRERGSRWDDWRRLAESDHEATSRELLSLLQRQFGKSSLFVLKDPRICRLLPLWKHALSAFDARVVAVLPLRHPLDVTASLHKRDGFSREKALLLWLRHVLDAERYSRALPRLFLPYEALLEDWQPWPARIGRSLDIQWPQAGEQSAAEIARFLNPDQRHHHANPEALAQDTTLDRWVAEAHAQLSQLVDEPENDAALQALDALAAQLDEAERTFGPAFADELRERQRAEQVATNQRHELEARLADRIQRLDQLETLAQERKLSLEQRAHRVQELEDLAATRKALLEDRVQRIEALERLSGERKAALEERAQRVAQLEDLASQRKRRIGVLQQGLEERAARAQQLEKQLGERKQQIDRLSSRLSTLEKEHLALFRRSRLESLQSRQAAATDRLSGLSPGRPPRHAFGQSASLNQRRRLWRQARKLLRSGLFDPRWYLLAYPDVMQSPLHPIWHWMIVGWGEGRRPNALFDPRWYLRQCPDVKTSGLNPLIHYLEHGESEGRHPGPLFSAAWYLNRHPDVARAGLNALGHYLQHGMAEGRQALELFDPAWYRSRYADVAGSGLDPLEHYLLAGGSEQRDPSPAFAGSWYLRHYQDVRKAGLNPLIHYLTHGRLEGRAAREEQLAAMPGQPQTALANPTQSPRFGGAIASRDGQPNVLVCAHAANGHLFGGERSFLDILMLLRELPYNVYVVVPALNLEYIEQIKPHCCEVTQIEYAYWRHEVAPDPQAQRRLQAYMVSRQIELVHVNTIVVREPLLAARALNIPSVVHVRESVHEDAWISEMMGLAPEELVQQVVDSADAVIANSRHTADEFRKPKRCFVVPNTFDMAALDIPNEFAGDRIRVGLISSNIPKKGLKDFVQLAQVCSGKLPEYEFLLIGPDNEHIQALKESQQSGKISDNLVFVGYQATPLDAVRQCNIVVNLSHFKESFGRTIAEALAARRPVIVYDHGAPQDLVQDGCSGHIIRYKHWQDAIPYLEAWARDRQLLLQMGEAGRQFVSQRFSREAGLSALEQAYAVTLRSDEARYPLTLPARWKAPGRDARPALRLAYFCWHFPVPSETFVLNELRLLVAEGIDVEVFCRQCPYPDFKPDFPVRWTRIKDVDDLARQLEGTGRNLVHAHFTYPTVTEMVWPACEKTGIPFTFIAHAQDIFKHENDRLNRIGELASARSCLAVFTLGRFHRDFLLARGVPNEKLIINPNGIDPSLFPFREPAAQQTKRICAIHRLTGKKGLHNLILAARALRGEGYEINIYGYGEEEERLQRMLDEEPLDFVRLHGPLKNREAIVEVLHAHQLFAAPSVQRANGDMDGIPTVLIEAMAAGTPVITSPVASITDLVQDGVTGVVVKEDDPAELAAGIRRFFSLDHEQVRGLTLNARAAVEARHDVRRLTHRLMRIWQQLPLDIVIVSWNNLTELQEVVNHLYAQTRSRFHLIICDNASQPEVTEFLFDLQAKQDNVTVVHKGWNSLVGPGTNTAIEQGDAEYAIYVCGKEGFALRDGWETDMVAWMDAHPKVGLAGSLGYSPSYLCGRDLATGIAQFEDFRNREFALENPDRPFFHVQGGLFILRRAMYEQIGGFSEAVPHAYTDVEYSYYAESCGWQLGNIPSVLALFNKTVPDIWSRIHEGVKVVHPPRLMDLPLLHRIVEERTVFCNCCGWSGETFSPGDSCPQCDSQPRHRSLYRHLAEGVLTFRRLPALWINPHPCLLPFWQRSFQGRQLSQTELLGEMSGQGCIDTATGALALIVLDSADHTAQGFENLLEELHRVLRPDGDLLLMPRACQDPDQLISLLQRSGFDTGKEIRYASSVLRYDLHPIHRLFPR